MTRAIPGFPILGFPTPAPQDHGGNDRNDKNDKNDRNEKEHGGGHH
jgi:hypothetical protein